MRHVLGWGALLLLTFINLRLFLQRWMLPPLQSMPEIISAKALCSVVVGCGAVMLAFCLIEQLIRRRILIAVVLSAVTVAIVWYSLQMPIIREILPLSHDLVALGVTLTLLAYRVKESPPTTTTPASTVGSFWLYTLASFNFFLFIAPFTTLVPSFSQDGTDPAPSLAYFYYGSIHSDVSIVSSYMRKAIGIFFDYPSINSTALSSMVYLSLGIAFCAAAIQLVAGRAWALVLVLAAWTDQWTLAAALASSIVGMPILSVGAGFFTAVWALMRKATPLTWRQTATLSLLLLLALLFNLYSYSAGRLPWLMGTGIGMVTLVVRGILPLYPFNRAGISKAFAIATPSILALISIWFFVFDQDTGRFKAQFLISPKPEQLVKDVNDYPTKIIPFHDVDMPIWWGSGRPENLNFNVYWRRNWSEIEEKLLWFFNMMATGSPIPAYLLILGAFSFLTGLASPIKQRRHYFLIVGAMTIGAFAPYILAQDFSAYRRGLATNLMLIVGIVSLFAMRTRGGILKVLSVAGCVGFCVAKAPLAWRPLLNHSVFVPLCIYCHEHFNIRQFMNSPLHASIKDRPLRIVSHMFHIPGDYTTCVRLMLASDEIKEAWPLASELDGHGMSLAQVYSSLNPGDIAVVMCPHREAQDPDLRLACQGEEPFGKLLGRIWDPLTSTNPKLVLIEKKP